MEDKQVYTKEEQEIKKQYKEKQRRLLVTPKRERSEFTPDAVSTAQEISLMDEQDFCIANQLKVKRLIDRCDELDEKVAILEKTVKQLTKSDD